MSNNNNSGGPDFVKKLFKMLEDNSYEDIVSWGVNGDSFVVKEIDAFTKAILPRHFKHSNFASFVRQLNKYDFHKIRSSDDSHSPYGEQAWEFRHPKFQCNKREQLEEIKRKTPTSRRSPTSTVVADSSTNTQLIELQNQINTLTKLQANMDNRLDALRKSVSAQDSLLQSLLQHLVNADAEKAKPFSNPTIESNPIPMPSQHEQAQRRDAASRVTPLPRHSQTVPVPANNTSRQGVNILRNRTTEWSVPPKVLLVDDDAVYQDIGAKLLRIFGCKIDIVDDGVAAVTKMKMNMEKYDLVLMDIALPRLDGVEATSQIRRFDPTTPIISMTSNTSAQDCVTYYSNGMNDILAKPFTKTRLFDVLDKYCMHLKVMPNFQEVSRIFEQPPPRIDDGSSLNENWVQSPVSVASVASLAFSIPNEGEEYNQAVTYPTGDEYMQMLVSLSSTPTTGTVRYIDDVYGDDETSNNRQRKRPKFELLE